MLRLVEIELFSYCNRQCKWCPNSFIDRHSKCEYLDILPFVISQLKEIDYKGYISFSRYNEPMSQIDYFKEMVGYIKKQMPECTLVTNTNGDYLSAENLDNLLIDELSIMDYSSKDIEWCAARLKDCGCEIESIEEPYVFAHRGDMKIIYYANWETHCVINNRGGSLINYNTKLRDYPCHEPKYFIGINYDGTVSPCCNIRNDIVGQAAYVYGDLHYESLKDILSSSRRLSFIEECENANFSKYSPCYQCLNKGGRYTRKKGGIRYV